MAIEHLDAQLRAAERRVERARPRQKRGGRRAQLGDLDRALAKRVIERMVQVARREQVDADAGDEHREQDAADGGEDGTAEQ